MAASSGASRPLAFVEDTAVAPERLNDYVARFKEILDRHGLVAGFYGHCSVGCLHVRPYVDLSETAGVETMRAVAEEIVDLVAEFDGVNSSEHGDGRARSEFNRKIFGDELYDAMVEVKRLFDPHGRLNPGVIVDAPPMTETLRDPALPPPGPLTTRLSFAEQGGMRGAADRCMRIGACRKTDAGVMCPSYMATREEEHSTRGRANALVKALSEPDPKGALGDARLHEILDLCLECKACKSECPLSVDMASLKSEFLSHYQDIHGVPARSRLFGAIRLLNRVGAATAPFSNLPTRLPPIRALLDRRLGIARHRPLPRFERETLIRWHRRRRKAAAVGGRSEGIRWGGIRTEGARSEESGPANPATPFTSPQFAGPGTPRGDLVFLADSFTTFTEPTIGKAAIELLEAAGWRVRLESGACCGRANISKGLLDKAKTQATRMAQSLGPEAERGVPIVGCEPSCLLTLREEHLNLLPDDPRTQAIAKQAHLVEELLIDAIDDGSLKLDPNSPVSNRRIVFHGHCHQKALAGTATTRALLERIPGADVTELDAGCCGMAGSFGFESEHYELSMRIGESRLFPALRKENETTVVAATGVSCRQQIAHGAQRRARHPVELVREALTR
jgi:Fe-S oxidoreductase